MQQDVINNEISVLCGIITSIAGLAFPLMLQAVERIDSKYNSRSLISMFCRSRLYFIFNGLSILSLFLLVVYVNLPKYNFAVPYIDTIGDFLIILTILLFLSLAYLTKTILNYYRTDNLVKIFSRQSIWRFKILEFIERHYPNCSWSKKITLMVARELITKIPSEQLNAWTDLLIYLIQHHTGDFIISAYQYLYKRILTYRKYGISDKEYIDYTEPINKSIVRINEEICKSKDRMFSFTNNVDLLAAYSGQYDDHLNGPEVVRTIWRCLIEQIYFKREDLLFSYWEYAVQRYDFYLDYKNDEKIKNYKNRYKEFYLFLSAHLLHSKRYNLLKTILFYSRQVPPSYPLIPSTLQDIVEAYERISIDPMFDQFYYESNYFFYDDKQPLTSNIVRSSALEYLVLLLFRLDFIFIAEKSVYSCNLNYEKTPRGIKPWIDTVNSIIEKAFNMDGRFIAKILPKLANYKNRGKAIQALKNLKKSLSEDEATLIETQGLSQKLIDGYNQIIKETVVRTIEKYNILTSSKTEIPTYDKENIQDSYWKNIYLNNISFKQIFSSSIFKDGQLYSVGNFAESIADIISYNISYSVAMAFMSYVPKGYTVKVEHLAEAFRRMQLMSNHILIIFGNKDWITHYLGDKYNKTKGLYMNSPIYFLPGINSVYTNRIIILSKDNIPKLRLKEPSQDVVTLFQYKPISQDFPLYSGLIPLNKESELKKRLSENNSFEMQNLNDKCYYSIYCYIECFIPKDSVKASLQIIDPYSSEEENMEAIKKLSQC